MHVSALFDIEDLFSAIDNGCVRVNKHPSLPLSIYTYTEECQFNNIWTPVTLQCRGLILEDGTFEVVGLPLAKFFNSNQHDPRPTGPNKMDNRGWQGPEWRRPLPDEPFEIFEKVDGSLITVFWYKGEWRTASKGSFASDQARWAQVHVNKRQYALREGLVYIAELIHPENRIVVDYKGREDLVLLAVRDTSDGYELPLDVVANSWRGIGSVVESLGKTKLLSMVEKAAAEGKNFRGVKVSGTEEEGYVLRFASGVRAKVKLAEYLVAHKLFTNTSERTVWEWLATGQDLSTLLAFVPDEFSDWVKEVAAGLLNEHAELICAVEESFEEIMCVLPSNHTRKDFAAYALKYKWSGPLFALHGGEGRKVSDWAWKQIRPEGQTARAFGNTEA